MFKVCTVQVNDRGTTDTLKKTFITNANWTKWVLGPETFIVKSQEKG